MPQNNENRGRTSAQRIHESERSQKLDPGGAAMPVLTTSTPPPPPPPPSGATQQKA
ncbi:hypothetical protein Ade02nite_40490 [Paractinoplanes deccanensis]|uniref:Uncharacterized protein n=1 Tax=Paractinoplanes deccanensis TaxID=113561 RepID=A0ABQ3Y5Z7_9ACTN|nr:hypothetical protein [Actinoplanes deccanensis]GID75408.1 hypothetical protein Ade02nite_40490 [Actinoplanes deccanensis]